MKKNILKIAVFSLALIGLSLFVNNSDTKAAVGELKLTLNAGTSVCYYGTSLDLSSHEVSYSGFDMTGNFLSNHPTDTTLRMCKDLTGYGNPNGWDMTISASALSNASSNTIANQFIKVSFDATTKVNGGCSYTSRTATDRPLSGTVEILSKSGATSDLCELQTDNVMLKVSVPDNQPAGVYTGTLTLTVPF